jgi:hypothetical protein
MKPVSSHARAAALAALAIAILAACPNGDLIGPVAPKAAVTRELPAMQHYFGNLHSHTRYSDGAGTPAQTLAWARDTVKYDFYAITDHAEMLSGAEWADIGAQVNAFTAPDFVAIRGFEYSNPIVGHINAFNTASYKGFWSASSLSSIYGWIVGQGAVAQWNHPGTTARPGDFSGFKHYPSALGNMALLETGNGNDGNIGGLYQKWYIIALDKGWKPAPTNNMDNHSMSANGHRTVIVAPSLTRDNLLSALRARRVYSTDDSNMRIAFGSGGAWMGSDLAARGDVRFDVAVEDDEMVRRLEIVSNGGAVVASLDCDSGSVVWSPVIPVDGKRWFYLRVYEANTIEAGEPTQLAITAPLFFNY